MRFARLGEGGVDRCVVGDVAFAEDAAEFGGDRETLFFLQVEDRDLDALRRERARGRGAEARGTAGDDGGYCGMEFHLFCLPNSLSPPQRGQWAPSRSRASAPRLSGGGRSFATTRTRHDAA